MGIEFGRGGNLKHPSTACQEGHNGRALPGPSPTQKGVAVGNLWLPLDQVVAEDKSYFRHGPRLVGVHAVAAEDIRGREVARMNPGKISAKEKPSILKRGRQCD